MTRILVFNVPASEGGAMTILNKYYQEAVADKKNCYTFVVSTPELKNTNNVKILSYKWVKKSWIHRIFFEIFVARKIVKTENPQKILSLQNTYIGNKNKIYQ